MFVAREYLGHESEAGVADRLDASDAHEVVLSETERRRSHVRTETTAGAELGITVPETLADGDVLASEDGDLVRVRLAGVDALAVSLDGVDPEAAIRVGHALGNRHRDLAVVDGSALVPTGDSPERIRETVTELLPDASTSVVTVSPATFDEGATPEHGHGPDQEHAHRHDEGDGHGHGHGISSSGGPPDDAGPYELDPGRLDDASPDSSPEGADDASREVTGAAESGRGDAEETDAGETDAGETDAEEGDA